MCVERHSKNILGLISHTLCMNTCCSIIFMIIFPCMNAPSTERERERERSLLGCVRHVGVVLIDVSEERIASIFRVEEKKKKIRKRRTSVSRCKQTNRLLS
jgi:hypothetical protein